MSTPTLEALGLTKEQVLAAVAENIANSIEGFDAYEAAQKLVKERVEKELAQKLTAAVDEMMRVEMDRLMRTEITPVDIWGDKTGKPTNLRAAITERARNYWEERVDSEGKTSTSNYIAKPRHEWVFSKIVSEAFTDAVKNNTLSVIGAFKDALRADAAKRFDEQLDQLIRVTSLGQQKGKGA